MFFKRIKFFDEIRDVNILSLVEYEDSQEEQILSADQSTAMGADFYDQGQLLEFLDE